MTIAPPAPLHKTRSSSVPGWGNVCLIMFAVAWGGNQFTPLLFMYRSESGFSEVTVNLLLFAYVVGLVPSLLLGAVTARRFGVKRMITVAVPVSALGSVFLIIGSTIPAVMFLGRALIGLALGIGMVVGALTFKALATNFTANSGENGALIRVPSGARSSAMALTAGFGLGAGLSGIAAQWLPYPTALPYILHLLVCLPAGAAAHRLRVEDNEPDGETSPDLVISKLPTDYLWRVLPAAPWIFGALGIAYAILPSVVSSQLGGFSTAFSAMMCLMSLGLGFTAQQVTGHFSRRRRVPARAIGIAFFIVGMGIAIPAASGQSLGLVILSAAVLGTGYGLTLAGCLQDCDRLARQGQLGSMTGILYTLAYLGFGLPMVVSWIHDNFGVPHPSLLIWIAGIALFLNFAGAATARLVRRHHRRLP